MSSSKRKDSKPNVQKMSEFGCEFGWYVKWVLGGFHICFACFVATCDSNVKVV